MFSSFCLVTSNFFKNNYSILQITHKNIGFYVYALQENIGFSFLFIDAGDIMETPNLISGSPSSNQAENLQLSLYTYVSIVGSPGDLEVI